MFAKYVLPNLSMTTSVSRSKLTTASANFAKPYEIFVYFLLIFFSIDKGFTKVLNIYQIIFFNIISLFMYIISYEGFMS